MRFSIVHIQNPLARRGLLLLLFVPIVAVETIIEIIKNTWSMAVDAEKAFEAAWKGRQ